MSESVDVTEGRGGGYTERRGGYRNVSYLSSQLMLIAICAQTVILPLAATAISSTMWATTCSEAAWRQRCLEGDKAGDSVIGIPNPSKPVPQALSRVYATAGALQEGM